MFATGESVADILNFGKIYMQIANFFLDQRLSFCLFFQIIERQQTSGNPR